MGIVSWIIAGLVAGLIASVVMQGSKLVVNVIAGAAGGVLAGWIATFFTIGAIGTFGWVSALIALGGGLIVSFVSAALTRARA